MWLKFFYILMLSTLISSSLQAAPSGSFNLQVMTKSPWPLAASTSGDNLMLKSRGRTSIHGSTKTSSSSQTKITGSANFSTAKCTRQSIVTVTLKFSKDGKFKSGNAKGKCVRANGAVRFSGRVKAN